VTAGPRSEVYLRQDIANVLSALALAGSGASDPQWRAGYVAALTATAAAFGLEPDMAPWAVVEPARRGRALAIAVGGGL
jgi:hypothetical protein